MSKAERSKATREFNVGRCFLAGLGAVVYSMPDGRRFVIAETIAGRKISAPKPYPDGGFRGNEAGRAANALAYLGIAGFASDDEDAQDE